eukprot:2478659-Rhodomonas_salina.2
MQGSVLGHGLGEAEAVTEMAVQLLKVRDCIGLQTSVGCWPRACSKRIRWERHWHRHAGFARDRDKIHDSECGTLRAHSVTVAIQFSFPMS